jgi:CRP-like cAMP-binding protein
MDGGILKIPEYYYEKTFEPFKEDLLKSRTRVTYPAGSQLNSIGEFMDKTFYIHQGVLKFYISDAKTGNEKTELFIGPSGLFPLYSPPERRYRMERDSLLVKAQTDVVVTPIPQKAIANLIDNSPNFAKTMLRQYADFTSILLYDAVILATQDNMTKVCNYLYQYERLLKPHGIILTQEEMAANVGVTLLTFSRVLKKLRQLNIVETSRKTISVIDWDKLVGFCSPELLSDDIYSNNY